MSQQESNGQDPDDEEEVPEAIFPDSGPGREEMVSDYLPESDDWAAKTHLNVSDPAAIAALRNMEKMFPEVRDLQPLIDESLDEFLKSRTSVRGRSREEFKSILQAMYGKSDSDEGGSRLELVAADDD
jgi:hypothetical protein